MMVFSASRSTIRTSAELTWTLIAARSDLPRHLRNPGSAQAESLLRAPFLSGKH